MCTHSATRAALMLFASAVLVAGSVLAVAQTRGTDPQEDVLAQLLIEVRQLRLAVERASLLGPSIQLAVHRLQLQEQRLNHVLQQARDVDRDLTAAVNARTRAGEGLAELQEALSRSVDDVERKQMEVELTALKQMIAHHTQSEQDLRQQQADVQQNLAFEQGRWNEINAWLDSMQRQLAAGGPPR